MVSVNLIFMFLIVLLMRKKKQLSNRTQYFPLFSVVSHGSKPATLHMRFKKCPVGKGSILIIYNELQSTLIRLQELGYHRVRFVSHLCRNGGTKQLLQFLDDNQMECDHFSVRPTPWIHTITNKVALLLTKGTSMKVSSLSLYITIKLH